MNANMVAVIKRIIAEQGESILADPVRLKGYVADYVAQESKAERIAFGRCIETGAYNELKNAPDAAARQTVKAAIARRVNANEAIDIAFCNDALDVLEAALFGRVSGQQTQAPQTGPAPQTAPVGTAQAAQKSQTARTSAPPKGFTINLQDDIQKQAGIMNKIPGRTFLFAIVTGLYWFLVLFGVGYPSFPLILFLGIPVKILLISKFISKIRLSFWRCVMIFLCEGLGYYLIFAGLSNNTGFYDTTDFTELLLFYVFGGVCFGISSVFYFPNYPPLRALCAVILGGIIGILPAIIIRHFTNLYFGEKEISYYIQPNFGEKEITIGSVIIDCVYLAILGFTISFVEEASRKAWLTIVYKTGKTSSVALGKTPVSFGSSKKALVRLPRYSFDQNAPGIRAVFTMEYDGGVFARDYLTGTLEQLTNGSYVDLGAAGVVVHIAGQKSP